MEEKAKLGMNKTGIDMSPKDSKEMIEGTLRLTAPPEGNDEAIADNRISYAKDAGTVGSIPLPGTMKGAVKSGIQMIKGKDPSVLLNKLGERAAFERAGVRLYDALISKYEASPDKVMLPPIDTINHYRNEELNHFNWVADAMRKLGADPTAMTPAADIAALASSGVQKVAVEPRANFAQTLEVILIAELADNDGWQLLIRLTEEAGLDDVASTFRKALQEENEHLSFVREWVEKLTMNQMAPLKKSA